MQVYEGEHLTGDIVAHGSGVRDLYYGVPDLSEYEFVGQTICTDKKYGSLQVQLKFKKGSKTFDVLLMPSLN